MWGIVFLEAGKVFSAKACVDAHVQGGRLPKESNKVCLLQPCQRELPYKLVDHVI